MTIICRKLFLDVCSTSLCMIVIEKRCLHEFNVILYVLFIYFLMNVINSHVLLFQMFNKSNSNNYYFKIPINIEFIFYCANNINKVLLIFIIFYQHIFVLMNFFMFFIMIDVCFCYVYFFNVLQLFE